MRTSLGLGLNKTGHEEELQEWLLSLKFMTIKFGPVKLFFELIT